LSDVTVRDSVPEDLVFMKRMLYEAANRAGEEWPPFDVAMDELRNRRFWSGLMTRSTDVGVIAEHNGDPIGACWVRQFAEGERGPMDEPGVPVLAIAVEP
jgi:hypothetical protein